MPTDLVFGIFGIDASSDTLRHNLDIIQTLSDNMQTPPDIGVFMQYMVLGERAISEYYELIENLPMDLVLVRPKISSFHIPDTIQTPLRHPQS